MPRSTNAAARAVMDRLRKEHGMLSKIAHEIGVYAQAVHQWTMVPLERVVDVERITGIPREELRPDFHLPRGVTGQTPTPTPTKPRKANGKAERKQQRERQRRARIHPERRPVRHQKNRSAQR